MGFLSGIFGGGGGGGTTTSSQDTTVKNTNNNYIDIHFEELANAQLLTLEETKRFNDIQTDISNVMYEYAIKLNNQKLSLEEKQILQQEETQKIQILQQQKALLQSEKNTKYTLIFGVIAVFFTAWQIFFKGKK